MISVVIPVKIDSRAESAVLKLKEWQHLTGNSIEVIVCGELTTDQKCSGLRYIDVVPAYKGDCVRSGILASHGEIVLVCDADVPVELSDLDALVYSVPAHGMSIGYRIYSNIDTKFQTPRRRRFASYIFRRFVGLLFGFPQDIDPQCGVKVFSVEAANTLFAELQTQGLGYDLEVLIKAYSTGIRVVSVPVSWKYSGSSISLCRDGFGVVWETISLWLKVYCSRPA